jgi:hypothetical protein
MPIFAFEVDGKAPELEGGPSVDQLNDQIAEAFNKVLETLEDKIGGIDSKPEKFIKAWGNASVFASHGATQRSYVGFNFLTVSVGAMFAIQYPSDPFAIVNDLEILNNRINNDGDIAIGVNTQLLNAHVSLNTSKFLLKNLYLGLRFGYMKMDNLFDIMSFNTLSLGITANYQILPRINLGGIVVWRGLNVGTGFIYQGTDITNRFKLGTIKESVNSTPLALSLEVDPTLFLAMHVNTFVIPLEVNTAVRLLWFLNLSLGVGADLAFGKSTLEAGVNGDITVDGLAGQGYTEKNPGNLRISGGGSMPPDVFNLKLMAGVGFSLGPVFLDCPITYYFLNNGLNIGITLGVTL